MPEMNLDDVHGGLLDDDEFVAPIEAPEDIEPSIDDEHDQENLFDLDPTLFEEPETEAAEPEAHEPMEESDLLIDLLRSKGIEDPTAINFENESGEVEQISFYDLSYEEQLEILKSSDADINYGLQEQELQTINFLRDNNVTFEEAVEYFQRKAIEDHLNSQNIAGIEVDQYADEELFALDLRSRYPDLLDEELEIELQKELEHPELFKKKVDKLRTDYKEIEEQQLAESRSQQAEADEQRRKELEDTLITTAMSVEDLGGLTLDDNDKNEVLSYILEKDMNGVSPFIKSLNSPQQLFELAWFATKGKEAFNIIHDYYKKEIAEVRKTSFEKGKQSASGTIAAPIATSNPSGKKSYTRKNTGTPVSPQSNSTKTLSINDLTID